MRRGVPILLSLVFLGGLTLSTSSCIVVTKENRTYRKAPRCGAGWHAVQKPNGRWKCKKNKPVRVHRR